MSKSNLLNAPLNIEEIDGSPSLWPWKLKVNNSTLTDNGDGTATLLMSLGALDITGFTEGSVLFVGPTAITENNSNFFWDDSLKLLKLSALLCPSVSGSDASGDSIIIVSTSHLTKGSVILGSGSNNIILNESDGKVTIGSIFATDLLNVNGAARFNGNVDPVGGNAYDLGDSINTWKDIYYAGDMKGVTGTISGLWTWTGGGIHIDFSGATALHVEDSGTEDDVFIVDTANGYVGIGTVPTVKLDIVAIDVTGKELTVTKTSSVPTLFISGDVVNVTDESSKPFGASGLYTIFHTGVGSTTGGQLKSLTNTVSMRGEASVTIDTLVGLQNTIEFKSTSGDYSDIADITACLSILGGGFGAAHSYTIGDYTGYRSTGTVAGVDFNITNAVHFKALDFPAWVGTVTNVTGVWVEHQTLGTNNYGIVLSGDDNGSGGADIVFGVSQDVRIYYDGVNDSGVFADGNWLMDSTNQLQFGDSGTYISQIDGGHLDLTADTSIDMNGVVEFESGIIVESDNKVNDYSMTITDYEVFIDGSSNTVDITMLASPVNGRRQEFACIDNTNKVQLLRNGKLIFGNAVDVEMIKGETFILTYDSTSGGWW